MLRRILLFWVIFGLILRAADPDIQSLVGQLTGRDTSHADLSVVTSTNRQQVILFARQIASGAVLGNDIGAQILLLRLGDSQAMHQALDKFQRYDSLGAWERAPFVIQRANQPLLIPFLAANLFTPSGEFPSHLEHKNGEGILVPARSAFSADLILETIIGSSEFSPALRDWAEAVLRTRLGEPKLYLDIMKRWWQQNESQFKGRNYKAVLPPLSRQD